MNKLRLNIFNHNRQDAVSCAMDLMKWWRRWHIWLLYCFSLITHEISYLWSSADEKFNITSSRCQNSIFGISSKMPYMICCHQNSIFRWSKMPYLICCHCDIKERKKSCRLGYQSLNSFWHPQLPYMCVLDK